MTVKEGVSLEHLHIADHGDEITVLHVDDDPDFAELAATFLQRESSSFRVLTATAVEGGWSVLRDREVDCVVSDYDMPGKNGLDFLATVREEYPELPFVLFTGKGSEEIASEAISAGVTEYLQKETGTDQYTVLANRIEQAVKRRRAEREVYRGFQAMESAQEGIGIIDEEGLYQYVNRSYAGIYDSEPLELIGEHWETLYSEAEVERFYDEILPELQQQGSWRGESVGITKHGEEVPESLALTHMDGGGHVCVVRDISDRKARNRDLRREQQFLHTALDALRNVFYVFDTDLRFLRWNDRVETVTGYTHEELESMSPLDLVQDDSERVEAAIADAISGSSQVTVEAGLHCKDGEVIPYEFTGSPVEEDGDVLGICGVGREIQRVNE
ncbi:PAS domain-containing response regulator [Halobellus captivus]|uniref:PAS domain-containing response regulator n=1 Tax=Halobellus captivus TaxID=2592614 RepID=UPI0011A0CB7F|nr:PAS domain S-box protein [Halobellus captivus]